MTLGLVKFRALGLGVGAAIGVLVALASGGCTITTSDTPLNLGDSGITQPDNDSAPPAVRCSECLFQDCRPQWTVCQNDAECRAIYGCSTQASGQEAVTACFCASPGGQAKYTALAACDQVAQCGKCATNCSATPGNCSSPGVFQSVDCPVQSAPADAGVPATDAAVDPPPTVPTDAATVTDCATCTGSKCAAETTACAPSSECDAFTLCTAACHDSACFDQCGTAHAAGKAASGALNTCTTANCATQCGL